MNRIRQKVFVFTLFMGMIILNSCENGMFATSWGTAFKRNPENVKVTVSNVNDLLKDARGDRELSRAIFDKTVELAGTVSGQDKAVLQTAAITAAKQAVALDMLVISNVGTLLDAAGGDGDGDIEKLLDDILEGVRKNKIDEISKALGDIFSGDNIKSNGKGEFQFANSAFTGTVSNGDLVNLIITIVLGKVAANEGSIDVYLDDWKTGEKTVDGTGKKGLDDEELVVAAAFNLLKERGSESELYDALNDIFGKKGETGK
jgi:ferritin-like metal-binding protein YciE